jgi:hypothetical protein
VHGLELPTPLNLCGVSVTRSRTRLRRSEVVPALTARQTAEADLVDLLPAVVEDSLRLVEVLDEATRAGYGLQKARLSTNDAAPPSNRQSETSRRSSTGSPAAA